MHVQSCDRNQARFRTTQLIQTSLDLGISAHGKWAEHPRHFVAVRCMPDLNKINRTIPPIWGPQTRNGGWVGACYSTLIL